MYGDVSYGDKTEGDVLCGDVSSLYPNYSAHFFYNIMTRVLYMEYAYRGVPCASVTVCTVIWYKPATNYHNVSTVISLQLHIINFLINFIYYLNGKTFLLVTYRRVFPINGLCLYCPSIWLLKIVIIKRAGRRKTYFGTTAAVHISLKGLFCFIVFSVVYHWQL
jgi:hypothetical protein